MSFHGSARLCKNRTLKTKDTWRDKRAGVPNRLRKTEIRKSLAVMLDTARAAESERHDVT